MSVGAGLLHAVRTDGGVLCLPQGLNVGRGWVEMARALLLVHLSISFVSCLCFLPTSHAPSSVPASVLEWSYGEL